MALGFSFLFLYPIQGLFKEHEVQTTPGEPCCQYTLTRVPLSGLVNL